MAKDFTSQRIDDDDDDDDIDIDLHSDFFIEILIDLSE
jgi:hypothetical protein